MALNDWNASSTDFPKEKRKVAQDAILSLVSRSNYVFAADQLTRGAKLYFEILITEWGAEYGRRGPCAD